ncbi:hypothetical protein UFOVP813_42 [uncultured Caudovirales phage]|uniref:Uncharacterized protein n=1 Tax=uncultured Caudovirales phage TaxID=2100421 RepID=A0A6J5P2V1_9CAUD|nr:hypothetical protein UFOVP813_42 [uncultured Caudovirales phage]
MKTLCTNGISVERFYDRSSRSSVTRTLDAEGNQIGCADYDGNKVSAAYSLATRIKDNGGKASVKRLKGKVVSRE